MLRSSGIASKTAEALADGFQSCPMNLKIAKEGAIQPFLLKIVARKWNGNCELKQFTVSIPVDGL
jgi:hypothetical protein